MSADGWFIVYAESRPRRRYLCNSRFRAELRAFLVGLRSWWPNPLNASRIVVEEMRFKPPA
jgi:hypothetical protein